MRARTLLLVSALVFLGLAPLSVRLANVDEGIVLHDAQRLVQGEMIYRDFWQFVAPGAPLLLAALFSLTGVSFAAAKLLLAAGLAAGSYLLARLGSALAGPRLGLAGALLVAWAAYPSWFVPNHHWWGVLAGLAAVPLLARGTERAVVGAGAAVGLAALFHQGSGVFLGLGALAFLLLARRWAGRSGLAQGGLRLAAGAATVWLPVLVWLALRGALPAFFRLVILYPVVGYNPVNLVPPFGQLTSAVEAFVVEPSPLGLAKVGFLLAVSVLPGALLLLAAVVFVRAGCASPGWRERVGLAATVLGLALYLSVAQRFKVQYALLWLPFSLLAALAVLGSAAGPARRIVVLLTAPLVVVLLSHGAILAWHAADQREPIVTRLGVVYESAEPFVYGATSSEDGAEFHRRVLGAIERRVGPGEATFVFPYSPLYYVLTDTRNATPYSYVYVPPGERGPRAELLQTEGPSPAELARLAAWLVESGPRFVFLVDPDVPPVPGDGRPLGRYLLNGGRYVLDEDVLGAWVLRRVG